MRQKEERNKVRNTRERRTEIRYETQGRVEEKQGTIRQEMKKRNKEYGARKTRTETKYRMPGRQEAAAVVRGVYDAGHRVCLRR
jgi:hypothetical protein